MATNWFLDFHRAISQFRVTQWRDVFKWGPSHNCESYLAVVLMDFDPCHPQYQHLDPFGCYVSGNIPTEWFPQLLHYIPIHLSIENQYTLHYITLHYTTLHYITLHYITLHYITYIHTLHYITLHYITLHYTTLHYITLHYITYIHT